MAFTFLGKWKIEFVHFFLKGESEIEIDWDREQEVKMKTEFSRNENLASDCGASSISDGIFPLSCMKKVFLTIPDLKLHYCIGRLS